MENTIKPALQAWTSGRVSGFYSKVTKSQQWHRQVSKVNPMQVSGTYTSHKTEYTFFFFFSKKGNPELFIEGSHCSGQPI